MAELPIEAVVGDIRHALEDGLNLVVVAPPGSGKTTRVPFVCSARSPQTQVVLLEPRRLAARLAAGFMARSMGGALGGMVGLVTRQEQHVSAESRVVVMTEGVLVRRMLEDPSLAGVSHVLVDEFHERSVQADLALALVREVQASLRPDLRIVVMSATMNPSPVAQFLEPCRVLEARGRGFPLRIEYEDLPDPLQPRALAKVLRQVSREEAGDVLAFLPGAAEIRRTARELEVTAVGRDVIPLYGEMSPRQQDAALVPRSRPRLFLATNVAESSVTIDGVGVVVDTGMFKQAEFDQVSGVERLILRRVGQHSADQRAGRAARQGPGRAVRLWPAHRVLDPEPKPEIHRVDLLPVILTVSGWSSADPFGFGWFEAPFENRVRGSIELLRRLGLLEPNGFRLTDNGRRVLSWPVHPRWGAVVARADALGVGHRALELAALAQGRDVLADRSLFRGKAGFADIAERARLAFRSGINSRSPGSSPSAGLHEAGLAEAQRALRQLRQRVELRSMDHLDGDDDEALARAILRGFPDRVGRVTSSGLDVALADGGRARLSSDSVVADASWIVALQLHVGPRGGVPEVRSAVRLDSSWLMEEMDIVSGVEARYDSSRQRVEGRRIVRFRNLILRESPARVEPSLISDALYQAALHDLDRAMPLHDELQTFLVRLRLLQQHAPELGFDVPPDIRKEVLATAVIGASSFAELQRVQVSALWGAIRPGLNSALAEHLPEQWTLPSGRRAPIVYREGVLPSLSAPIQELFGLEQTPSLVKGRLPVQVELLGPNRRPIQVTRDLRSFWASTYAEVRKHLRGRYPKHHWPEHPTLKDAGPLGRRRGQR
ncbi:MAG: ATP-dependent helicase HrpB [Myxococcota bacterium]